MTVGVEDVVLLAARLAFFVVVFARAAFAVLEEAVVELTLPRPSERDAFEVVADEVVEDFVVNEAVDEAEVEVRVVVEEVEVEVEVEAVDVDARVEDVEAIVDEVVARSATGVGPDSFIVAAHLLSYWHGMVH